MSDSRLARVLRAIQTGEMTRAEAAEALDCSGRHVNRLMAAYGVVKPRGKTVLAREAARGRQQSWEEQQEKIRAVAARLAARQCTVKQALQALLPIQVSERTLFRYAAEQKVTKRKRFSSKSRKE